MRFNTKLAATGLLLSTMAMAGTASAGVSGNIAVGSDYLWRGMTQNNHIAAVSGGLDYSHDSGVYVGTWTSNLNGDIEVDLYGGFSKEFSGLGIDVGAIYYAYPIVAPSDNNFYEAYLSLSYSIVSASVYYDPDNKNLYASAGVDYEIKKGLSVGVSGGYISPDVGDAMMHYGASITKSLDDSEFSLMVSDTDSDVTAYKNPTMAVSWSKSFDL